MTADTPASILGLLTMEHKEKTTIFHLYRQDGTALFLHPFDSLDKLMNTLKRSEIVGKYGTEPRVESLTLFRNDLYRLIEDAVKSWVSEKRFIPRFMISAVIFLLAYLFLSFVIPDPIPLLDEILIGAAAAFGGYFLLSRRDQRSNLALKKRVELRTAVDRIVFSHDRFVKELEDALQHHESASREALLEEMIGSGIEKRFVIEDEGDAKQLITYLEKRFSTREYRKQEKLLSRARDRRPPAERNVQFLSRWSESKKIDLSLFAIYRRMKKSYRSVK